GAGAGEQLGVAETEALAAAKPPVGPAQRDQAGEAAKRADQVIGQAIGIDRIGHRQPGGNKRQGEPIGQQLAPQIDHRKRQQRAAKQFIFASSEWVYDSFDSERRKSEDDPVDIAKLDSEYAISKLVCEANLRQQHRRGFCPVAILRFGIIYGPRLENWSAVESILNAVATRDEVTVGALSSGRHFIHVADIADAILASVGLPGFQVLNVQGRDLITLGQIAEVAKALLGRNPRIVEKSPGDFNRRPVSSRLAQSVLGWQAQVGLEAGLKSVVEFWEAEST
ncbi:MAG: NAD(P)-dependent oxidoreductase, partial [Proteobacteria bacterium]|nr:NAD(P)-dependent oxidoreductase [Pseudomonadota bacterium]